MTDKVNPSISRPAEAFKTAGAIALAGGSSSGWISPAGEPSDISTQDDGITEANLNAFEETSSSTSLDVTIDPGEAFVYGAWLADDTSTTVTLAASTNGQTVYVGWNKDSADDVIVGLDSAFAAASGNTDEKIPLYDFDTDGSGVTAVTDRREIGQYQNLSHLEVADELGIPVYSDTTNAPQSEGNIITIDGSGTQDAGLYSHNGASYTKSDKTVEEIEDIVGALISGSGNISVNYDDVNNTLTIDTTALDEVSVKDLDETFARGTAISSYLVKGGEFTVNYTTPDVSISDGLATITNNTNDKTYIATWNAQTISLTDASINHIYVTYDPSTNTTALNTNTTGTKPDNNSLKIGEVNTTNDTKSEKWYLAADDGTPTFPSETAGDTAAATMKEGTQWYDRTNNTYYKVI